LTAVALAECHPALAQEGTPAEPKSLKPLSSIDVESLTSFRDKPLFAPDRQPLASTTDAELTDEAMVIYPEDEPLPNVRLLGVVQVGQERTALVEDLDALTTVSVKQGDSVGPWIVAFVEPARVVLRTEISSTNSLSFNRGQQPRIRATLRRAWTLRSRRWAQVCRKSRNSEP
jgi:hypothetical protein